MRAFGHSRHFWLPGHRRRASALVELAIAMPVIMMLVFGVMEYGYFLYVKNTLQGAARDGARQAVIATATNATVQTAVDTAMLAAGLQASGYSVTTSPANVSGLPSGQAITVTVTCNWGTMGVHPLPQSLGGIGNSKLVQGVALMNRE